MPKVSGNYNSDLPKVGSVKETDNLKLPKISHLFKVSKNDYHFAWLWLKTQRLNDWMSELNDWTY